MYSLGASIVTLFLPPEYSTPLPALLTPMGVVDSTFGETGVCIEFYMSRALADTPCLNTTVEVYKLSISRYSGDRPPLVASYVVVVGPAQGGSED